MHASTAEWLIQAVFAFQWQLADYATTAATATPRLLVAHVPLLPDAVATAAGSGVAAHSCVAGGASPGVEDAVGNGDGPLVCLFTGGVNVTALPLQNHSQCMHPPVSMHEVMHSHICTCERILNIRLCTYSRCVHTRKWMCACVHVCACTHALVCTGLHVLPDRRVPGHA